MLFTIGRNLTLPCKLYLFSFYHLDKHTPTYRWGSSEWESNLTDLQLCQQEFGGGEEGRGIKGDKRKRGKEMQVFMLARLFLQSLEFYLTYVWTWVCMCVFECVGVWLSQCMPSSVYLPRVLVWVSHCLQVSANGNDNAEWWSASNRPLWVDVSRTVRHQ